MDGLNRKGADHADKPRRNGMLNNLPPPDMGKTLHIGRILVLGTLVAAGVSGGVVSVREWITPQSPTSGYEVATEMKKSDKSTPFWFPVNVYGSGSGGTAEYDVAIVKNPLKSMSGSTATNAGSGIIMDGWLEIGDNPTEASYDVCFVDGLLTASGSLTHRCVITDSRTDSGAVIRFDTGALITFNGDHYLAVKTLTTLTGTGNTLRLRFIMHDTFGE